MEGLPDPKLLSNIAETDQFIRSNIDLIPINNWGFDDSIREKIRQRKHFLVNQRLFADEKKILSKTSKQDLARYLGSVCRTVSDVLEWLKQSNLDTNPKSTRQKIAPKDKNTENNQQLSNDDKNLTENANISEQNHANSKNTRSMHETEVSPNQEMKSESDESVTGNEETSVKGANASKPAASNRKTSKLKREKISKSVGSAKANFSDSKVNNLSGTYLDSLESRKLILKRLEERIEKFKSKRFGKRTAEQYEECRKLKRRLSKMKRKDRIRAEKKSASSATVDSTSEPPNKRVKTENSVPPHTTDGDGKLIFSKFDFVVKDVEEKPSKKDKRDKFSGKDYKGLLAKAEKRKERIEGIREKDPEKAERLEDNIKWHNAMSRVQGGKVKDNPDLLKKSLKRKENIKSKRKENWTKRIEHVDYMKLKKQEKRNANISARKETVKKKKFDKARKKGRIF